MNSEELEPVRPWHPGFLPRGHPALDGSILKLFLLRYEVRANDFNWIRLGGDSSCQAPTPSVRGSLIVIYVTAFVQKEDRFIRLTVAK